MTRAGWLGVQLATASEPPARERRIWGVAFWRRHQPPLSCDLLLNHAQIDARLQKMGGVAVPQRVDRHRLAQPNWCTTRCIACCTPSFDMGRSEDTAWRGSLPMSGNSQTGLR